MTKKIVLFDFCETLVKKQTADDFVKFVISESGANLPLLRYKFIKSKLYRLLFKFKLVKTTKLAVLDLLTGFSASALEEFGKKYIDDLKSNFLITDVYDIMLQHYNDGHEIVLISGGYDIYIKSFEPEIVSCVICSEVEFIDNICTGKIKGKDCLGDNKLSKLFEVYEQTELEKRYKIFYSDHHSDLPLLKYADKGVVVSKNKEAEWSKLNKLEEIIWCQ